MKDKIDLLHKWKHTKKGLLIVGILELMVTYGFASWAIDSGSLWLYLLTVIFLVGSLKNIFRLVNSIIKKNESR